MLADRAERALHHIAGQSTGPVRCVGHGLTHKGPERGIGRRPPLTSLRRVAIPWRRIGERRSNHGLIALRTNKGGHVQAKPFERRPRGILEYRAERVDRPPPLVAL